MQIIALVLAAAISVSAKPTDCASSTSATAAVPTYVPPTTTAAGGDPSGNYNPYNPSAPKLTTMYRPPAVETKSVYIPPAATQLYSGASTVAAVSTIALVTALFL
ncbi:UNVERIFIED_CONTAM: hypothetical protein HDU68_000217 [Siphonaria sp. JEL0065]|nr:hypothetical protein HDU68_000217 [Siphonaria sp. JEL0065]